jgi:hypothetical protein
VCAIEFEREREREGGREGGLPDEYVTRERKRGRERLSVLSVAEIFFLFE